MTIATADEIYKGTVLKRVHDHYDEALQDFDEDKIVGCFLQGSQNYGLELPDSDVDTKLIVLPTFRDIALASKPISTTHIRANDEHTDWKDIRLYMETFRKQNLNFLEILFTDYSILNPKYKEEWMRLVDAREQIAHMNPFRAVKSMKGIALEKYHAMEHRYPSKTKIIDKYGYDPKQTHHLLRVEDYLERYIAEESYENCLCPTPAKIDHLMAYKYFKIPLDQARREADEAIKHIEEIANDFCEKVQEKENESIRELLNDVCCNIMKIAVRGELN